MTRSLTGPGKRTRKTGYVQLFNWTYPLFSRVIHDTRPLFTIALAVFFFFQMEWFDVTETYNAGISILRDPATVYWVECPSDTAGLPYRLLFGHPLVARLHLCDGATVELRSTASKAQALIQRMTEANMSIWVGASYDPAMSACQKRRHVKKACKGDGPNK